MTAKPYTIKFQPKILKQLLLDCDVSQNELAIIAGGKQMRPTINLVVNRKDYMPARHPEFRAKVEAFILARPCCVAWLVRRQLRIADVWKSPPKEQTHRKEQPLGHGVRVSKGMAIKSMVLGDPEADEREERSEMLTMKAMKLFKLFKNPFNDDIDPEKDVYLSEDHRYIHMAMSEAARHCGFIAVIGEVGSGKTMMRRLLIHELKKDENIRVIFPRIIDKTRITAASICDAIIMDLDKDAKPKNKLEQKSRQVETLLLARAKAGIRMVMLIEEAQDLSACPRVLKLFKRFHEIEDGTRKVLGIVLIGQPELGDLLNEGDHYDMREVIRRIQVAEIQGLNGHIKEYLVHKFKRVKPDMKIGDVIADNAIDALSKRLTAKDEHLRDISVAYPLTVNNYMVRAMNAAAAHGEDKVTEEVVNRMI